MYTNSYMPSESGKTCEATPMRQPNTCTAIELACSIQSKCTLHAHVHSRLMCGNSGHKIQAHGPQQQRAKNVSLPHRAELTNRQLFMQTEFRNNLSCQLFMQM